MTTMATRCGPVVTTASVPLRGPLGRTVVSVVQQMLTSNTAATASAVRAQVLVFIRWHSPGLTGVPGRHPGAGCA